MGASIKPPHLYLITELCSRGSLHDVLRVYKVAVPKKRRKQMLIDAALGMLYLHSENIIHRYVVSLRNFRCMLKSDVITFLALQGSQDPELISDRVMAS